MSPSPFTRFRVAVSALLVLALTPTPALPQAPGADAWSAVARLAPGTEITVTTGPPESAPNSVRSQRFVLRVDQAGLSTISLAGLRVSRLVHDVLRDAAVTHPGYFEAAGMGRSRPLAHGVRIGPSGISVAGRAVAPLSQVLERIDRSDIVQIVRWRTIRRGSAKQVLKGAAIGFIMTLTAAANGGTGPNYCTRSERGCAAVAGAGLAAGAAVGYWGGKNTTTIEDEIVYRR